MERWHLITIFSGVFLLTVLIRIYSPTNDIRIASKIQKEIIEQKTKPRKKKQQKIAAKREVTKPTQAEKRKEKREEKKIKEESKARKKVYRLETESPEEYKNELFHYDTEAEAYVVHSVSGVPFSPYYSEEFLRLFVVLDKALRDKYYLSDAYKAAYKAMDKSFSDVYLWSFLTNKLSKLNLFAYLLKKYSEDNKKWSPYKKDKADCTQFSERAYFFMYPGEVYIRDQEYFEYLFSSEKSITERAKHINKIPEVVYVTIKPFIFKNIFGTVSEKDLEGHAMVGFKTVSNFGELWVVGEPQSGAMTTITKLRKILPENLRNKSNVVTMGNIVYIPKDPKKEPITTRRLSSFLYHDNPNVDIDTVSAYAEQILYMLKKCIESNGGDEREISNFFSFLKLAFEEDDELGLIRIQEATSSAVNILIRELEKTKANSSGDIMMKISKKLKSFGNSYGYMENKNDISLYIEQFRFLVMSKLQYWWYFPTS